MHKEGQAPSRRTVLRGALVGAAFSILPAARAESGADMWDKKMNELASWKEFCDTVESLLDDRALMRTADSYRTEVSKEICFLKAALVDAMVAITSFRLFGSGSSPSSDPLLQKEQEVRNKLHIADEAIKRFLQRSRDTTSTLSRFFHFVYGDLEAVRAVQSTKRA